MPAQEGRQGRGASVSTNTLLHNTGKKGTAEPAARNVFIVGLPNSGKTQLFNRMTRKYKLVANYPMTTIESHSASIELHGNEYRITDTPGIHCLFIQSEEEKVIRDDIFAEEPDLIIQCIDENRIKQSLYLTADLLELQVPLIIALTAIDETEKNGRRIKSSRLARKLGVPVIETSSEQQRGIREIGDALQNTGPAAASINYGPRIEDGIAEVEAHLPEHLPFRRKTAVLMLETDPEIDGFLRGYLPEEKLYDIKRHIHDLKSRIGSDLFRFLNKKRNIWVDQIYEEVSVVRISRTESFSRNFARLSRHPVWGTLILFVFLLISYFMVVYVAGFLEDGLNLLIFDPLTGLLERSLQQGFVRELLIGEYGILTLGLFTAVGTVLPVLSVFFMVFGFMEDIGYLPNLTVLVKRALSKIGLSGKSIMPLILGFGCKTMATLTVKSVPSRKERLIAVYLIAFGIPCSAQLGLNIAILGKYGLTAFFIAVGFLVLVEVLAGSILNKVIKSDRKSSFIQELPPIRSPNLKSLAVKTGYRLFWFLKEAIPVFIIAAALLFLLDLSGFLDALKNVLSPLIIHWLGLPLDMVDALILTMARHEAGAGLILKMSEAGMLNWIQSIVAVVITTMFIPCIANIVAIFREEGVKAGIIITLSINISSFILAGLLNWALLVIT
jgi:ferrous iron transport protein B